METAEVLKVSVDTVMRDWKLARAWPMTELSGKDSGAVATNLYRWRSCHRRFGCGSQPCGAGVFACDFCRARYFFSQPADLVQPAVTTGFFHSNRRQPRELRPVEYTVIKTANSTTRLRP